MTAAAVLAAVRDYLEQTHPVEQHRSDAGRRANRRRRRGTAWQLLRQLFCLIIFRLDKQVDLSGKQDGIVGATHRLEEIR